MKSLTLKSPYDRDTKDLSFGPSRAMERSLFKRHWLFWVFSDISSLNDLAKKHEIYFRWKQDEKQ